MHYYTLPVSGHQFKGESATMNHLLALFMKWAEKKNIFEVEAIAMWFSGSFDSSGSNDSVPGGFGFLSWAEIDGAAEIGFRKMPKETDCVDLSGL